MRITAVHSAYSSASVSGENVAVAQQCEALTEAGHDVDLHIRSTDDLATSSGYALTSGLVVATGWDRARDELPPPEGREHILLVHNLFPNFGSRWLRQWPGPVVTMIHNYRYLCANGLLLREGVVCTDCLRGSNLPALVHSCYRGSVVATLPLVVGNRKPAKRLSPLAHSDAVITQTERARGVYESAGVSRDLLHFVPGFGPSPDSPQEQRQRAGFVFVGRLSSEKGLVPLLGSWPAGHRLDVIGDGPEREVVHRFESPSIRYLGSRSHDEVLTALSNYRGLVFPGLCWEGAHPMVVREAFAHGLPVVAARGSSAADIVTQEGGGAVYEPGSPVSLLSALDSVATEPQLAEQAARLALGEFARGRWQSRMNEVLAEALAHRQRRN